MSDQTGPTIFLKLFDYTSRFFDIRRPQDDQTFVRFATGGEIGVFNVHFGLGEAFCDLPRTPGWLAVSIVSTSVSRARTPASPKSMSAFVGSLTTIRTTVWSTVSDVAYA